MTLLALDPGSAETAYVVYRDRLPVRFGKVANERMLELLPLLRRDADSLAVEMIASYGMPVGREVFETCVYIGRYIQAWKGPHRLVYRKDVKMHLCGAMRAKDPHVRQALLDRYGGKVAAIGCKARPGVLYGMRADVWAALAVAITAAETQPLVESA